MKLRIFSGLMYAILLLVTATLGGWSWWILVMLLAFLGLLEAQSIEIAAGRSPSRPIGWLLAPALVLTALPATATGLPEDAGPAMIALATIAAFAAQIARSPEGRSTPDWMASLIYPIYLGTLLGFLPRLRALGADAQASGSPVGLAWTILLLALIWVNDSGAYLGGHRFGKNPFFATISPRKTREGALTGGLLCILVGALAPAAGAMWPVLAPLRAHSPLALGLVGLVIALVAPAGDLAESVLKRQAGVKDSGRLIPGHGGILDRIDSLLFAAPVIYFLARWLGG
jgi:phosphatidate cytidylyltransferase